MTSLKARAVSSGCLPNPPTFPRQHMPRDRDDLVAESHNFISTIDQNPHLALGAHGYKSSKTLGIPIARRSRKINLKRYKGNSGTQTIFL